MRLINSNNLAKILVSSALGFIVGINSTAAQSEIYKWRDNSGVTQYSDKAPTNSVRESRSEILTTLQTKDICSAPNAIASKKTLATYQSNFFRFNPPSNVGFSRQSTKPNSFSDIGNMARANSPARNLPSWLGLPVKPIAAKNPRNTAPIFSGLNPTSFFNIGNQSVTVFGRPISVVAAKQPVKQITPTPTPTPTGAGPANYNDNLAMIRQAISRNTLLDNSRFRNVAMLNIPTNELLGPREDYLKFSPSRLPANGFYPDEGSEPDFPVQGVGSFRTACEFSHFSYDDPIVYPNKPGAAHLHMFWGNTDVNAYSTYNTLINSGSSTCNGMELNRTGYWAPAMFDADGNVRIPSKIIIYYKGYGLANGKSVVYPPGAAMVTNDIVHRTPDSSGGAAEMNFMCSDQYRGDRSPASMTIPNCDGARWQKVYPKYGAATMLEMHVKFPNCWNRQDPANPKNWILAKIGGWFYSECQENATTPNIHYIIQYPLERNETSQGWYIASDVDPVTRKRTVAAGSSVHADWWGGWHPAINKQWIDNCVNLKKSVAQGCGFGYLTDGGPDNAKPLPGPALKFRQKYPGPFKVSAASLYKQLCDASKPITSAEQAAYCRPAGHMNHSL